MTREAFLYSLLAGTAGLSALVSTRISPMRSLQAGDLPCVTYLRSGGGYEYSQDGPDEQSESSYQFDCWASTHETAAAVAEQLRAALTTDSPADGFYALVDSIRSGYEDDTRIHRITIDARVWYRESA